MLKRNNELFLLAIIFLIKHSQALEQTPVPVNSAFNGWTSPQYPIATRPQVTIQPQILSVSPLAGVVSPAASSIYQQHAPIQLVTPGAVGVVGTMPGMYGTVLPNPGPQTVQLPCTLQIQSPAPLTLAPGAVQGHLVFPNYPPVPPSYIDQSTPTVSILRPPSPPEMSMIPSNEMSAPIQQIRDQILYSLHPKTVRTIPNPTENSNLKNIEPIASSPETEEVARHGLPFVFTVLPYSSSAILPQHTSKSVPSRPAQNDNTPQSRTKNPYFNVNKRKHFEFYQYF